MSKSQNEAFETQFAAESLSAGIELSPDVIRAARGPDGEYSQYPYMQTRWNRFNASAPKESIAGAAQ